jgi:predicted secreted hydrolase
MSKFRSLWRGLGGLVLLLAAGAAPLQLSCEPTPPEFAYALPGRPIEFPRDHASHPEFQTEWWYYTGHLMTAEGSAFGFQLTFFRHALTPSSDEGSRWRTRQLFFGHFAVTDEEGDAFFFSEKISRGSALDDAGARSDRYRTWIDRWVAEGLGRYQVLHASADSIALDLVLTPAKPPVLNGDRGYSRKGRAERNATYYYSMTRLGAEGVLDIGGVPREVTGEAWLDREWGTSQLDTAQVGWDWFSMQLDNGEELMLYVLRRGDGTADGTSSGTYTRHDGTTQHLKREDFAVEVRDTWRSPESGAEYPSGWVIWIPALGAELRIDPTVRGQELRTEESTRVTYWEGSVRVEGTLRGQSVRGKGYTELTGYAAPLTIGAE